MAFDWTGALLGFAGVDDPRQKFKLQQKQYELEQQAADKQALREKQAEEDRLTTAKKLKDTEREEGDKRQRDALTSTFIMDPETVSSGVAGTNAAPVMRPAWTSAKLAQDRAGSFPTLQNANRASGELGAAPYARDLGTTASKAELSVNNKSQLEADLAADNASIELDAKDLRGKRTTSGLQSTIGSNLANIGIQGNRLAKEREKFRQGAPESEAGQEATTAQLGYATNVARAENDLPGVQARAEATTLDLQGLNPAEIADRKTLENKVNASKLAVAEKELLLNSIKSGVLEKIQAKLHGGQKPESLTQQEVQLLSLWTGVFRPGAYDPLMQNSGLGGLNPWDVPSGASPNPSTATPNPSRKPDLNNLRF
jgi:hypothetical protein